MIGWAWMIAVGPGLAQVPPVASGAEVDVGLFRIKDHAGTAVAWVNAHTVNGDTHEHWWVETALFPVASATKNATWTFDYWGPALVEGKRPVNNLSGWQTLLFINTKTTPSNLVPIQAGSCSDLQDGVRFHMGCGVFTVDEAGIAGVPGYASVHAFPNAGDTVRHEHYYLQDATWLWPSSQNCSVTWTVAPALAGGTAVMRHGEDPDTVSANGWQEIISVATPPPAEVYQSPGPQDGCPL